MRTLFCAAMIICMSLLTSIAASQDTEPSLLEKTLPLDISTASYYELTAWCESLGIVSTGARADLQTRLYDYYGITPTTPEIDADTTVSSSGRTISIVSADRTRYWTDPHTNEKLIMVSGNVVLEMVDQDDGSRHTIQADSVTVNQATKTVSAEGNLVYQLAEGSSDEQFRGDSLSFGYETWEGVFLYGASVKDRDVDGTNIPFEYSGDVISRVDKDTIILEQGSVTSSKQPDPYYRIDANEIMVLAPGEWGIKNAVLYIGRIPVFWIPFFFRPGDEIIFHPTFDTRQIEGFTAQTTTYLIGSRDREDSAFSFLQIGDETAEGYDTESRGIFLRRIDSALSGDSSAQTKGDYLKLLVDLYSRMGFYVAIDGALSPGTTLQSLNIYGGIGISRNIYGSAQSPDGFTYITDLGGGEYGSSWNQADILGLTLPFRFGLSVSLALNGEGYDFSAALPFYSDPYFTRDFGDRSEKLDWAKMLGLEGTGASGDTSGSTKDSFEWFARASYDPDLTDLQPYVESLRITNIDGSVSWKGKDNTAVIPPANASTVSYPNQRFHYPDGATFPDLSMRISGTLIDSNWEKPQSDDASDSDTFHAVPGIKPPTDYDPPPHGGETNVDEEVSPEEGIEEDEIDPTIPEPREPGMAMDVTLPAPVAKDPFVQKLTYQFLPVFTFDTRSLSASWNEPADVSLITDYSLLNARPGGSFLYTADLVGKALTVQDTVKIDGMLLKHVWVATGTTLAPGYTVSDTSLSITNSFKLSSQPFGTSSILSSSNASYSVTGTLYEWMFLDVDGSDAVYGHVLPDLTKDTISSHTASLDLIVDPGVFRQQVKTDFVIPPLDPSVSLLIAFFIGPYSTDLTAGVTQGSSVTYDPIRWSNRLVYENIVQASNTLIYVVESATHGYYDQNTTDVSVHLLDQNLSFGQEVSYDIQNARISAATTSVDAWLFNAKLYAAFAEAFNYSSGVGWISAGDDKFRVSKVSTGFSYDYTPDPYWKNRILFSLGIDGAWNINLLRFSENLLSFNVNLDIAIKEFLTLSFTTRSENRATHLYFPGFATQAGLPSAVNPLSDLLRSFNFFNKDDRERSSFNLKSIDIKATHELRDWDLEIEYRGFPTLNTLENEYVWGTELSIFVAWKAIPEVKRNVNKDESGNISLQ